MLLYDSKYLKSLLKNILRSYDLHAGTADTMEGFVQRKAE